MLNKQNIPTGSSFRNLQDLSTLGSGRMRQTSRTKSTRNIHFRGKVKKFDGSTKKKIPDIDVHAGVDFYT